MELNTDAKKAISETKKFLEDYYSSFRLISAILKDSVWVIVWDVGFLHEEIKKVQVDAASGKILGVIDVSKD